MAIDVLDLSHDRLADIRFMHIIKALCFFYYLLILPFIWLGKKIWWGCFVDTASKKQKAERAVLRAAAKKGPEEMEKVGMISIRADLEHYRDKDKERERKQKAREQAAARAKSKKAAYAKLPSPKGTDMEFYDESVWDSANSPSGWVDANALLNAGSNQQANTSWGVETLTRRGAARALPEIEEHLVKEAEHGDDGETMLTETEPRQMQSAGDQGMEDEDHADTKPGLTQWIMGMLSSEGETNPQQRPDAGISQHQDGEVRHTSSSCCSLCIYLTTG